MTDISYFIPDTKELIKFTKRLHTDPILCSINTGLQALYNGHGVFYIAEPNYYKVVHDDHIKKQVNIYKKLYEDRVKFLAGEMFTPMGELLLNVNK